VKARQQRATAICDDFNIYKTDCFKHLFALFNQINRRSINSTPNAQNLNEPGVTAMKTRLILALTLSVLAANTFAADGYDRTGSATFSAGESAAVASDGFDHTGTAGTVASDGFDHTGTAGTVAADGFDRTGTASAIS